MKKSLNFRKVSCLLIFFLIFSLLSLNPEIIEAENNPEGNLAVHYIDVGQGDAILIQTEDDKNMLIDGGDRWDWIGEKLTSYLYKQGVETVHAMVGTHPHADHIGGLPAVIENFAVKKVYDSGRVHTTRTYENYLRLIDKKDIPFVTPRRGEEIELGGLTFEVLHPTEDIEDYSLNDASIVLRLEYDNVSFLFTGDAEYEAEREIVESSKNPAADILKVGHHGSSTSTNDFFLEAVNPGAAIIQVGEDNRYGHPHDEVLEALEARNVDIYRNDLHGDVVVKTNGHQYWTEIAQEGEPRAPPEDDADLININTAGENELQELHGIGPATAENIIEYREEHGGFDYIEEIKEVSGIGPATFEDIKDDITI